MYWRDPVEVLGEALSMGIRSPRGERTIYKGHTGGVAQTRPSPDNNALVADCCEAGLVIAAVDALPALPCAWAWVCYGPKSSEGQYSQVCANAWKALKRVRNPGESYSATWRLVVLARFAVEDAAALSLRAEPKHTPGALAEAVGLTASTWSRSYADIYREGVNALLDVNQEVISAVLPLIYKAKQDRGE